MKKIYMTMVAMLFGVAAMAQENKVYIEDQKVDTGGGTIDVPICLENAVDISRIQFAFSENPDNALDGLPEGITYETDEDEWTMIEDRLDLDAARLATKKPTGKLEKVFKFEWAGRWVMFSCAAGGYTDADGFHNVPFIGSEGALFTIPFTVDDTVADGAYTINFWYKVFGTVTDPYASVPTEGEGTGSFTITVGAGTGITSINAADSKAPIYNVAGQRVSKAQKGVFIQNGKKVAVK